MGGDFMGAMPNLVGRKRLVNEVHVKYFLVDRYTTYQTIDAIPAKAATQLKTKATMPLAVKPAGRGATDLFSPVKSYTSSVFPAALPAVATPLALQIS
jgi:hypothetical protein